MKNILLFGSTGLIGSSVIERLSNGNYNLYSFGRKNCDYYFDLETVQPIELNHKSDIIVYCAGVTDEEILNDKERALKRNTVELIKLVDWAKKIGTYQFIYISSAHVYGDLNREINPKTNVEPRTLYAALHFFAENYIKSIFEKSTIIRPGAVYGKISTKFDRWELIPFSFPKDLAINKKIIIRSHGKQWRNFISSNTIAEIIIECIEKSISGVINPVGFYSMSISDFAKFCIKTINQRKTNNSMLNVELLGQGDYKNKFKYISTPDLPEEDESLLKDHIYDLYRKILEN